MKLLLRASQTPFDNCDALNTIVNDRIWGNVGNLLFANSIYKTFYCKENQIDLLTKPVPQKAAEINSKYDILILPFANAFRKDFTPQLRLFTDLINKLKIPVVVTGIGLQGSVDYSSKDVYAFDDDVKAFCKAVLEHSSSIGVRGRFTEDYLNRLGFKDVDVIGCPSMFFNGDELKLRNTPISIDCSSPIAINCSSESGGLILDYLTNNGYNYTFVSQSTKELKLLFSGKCYGKEKLFNSNYPYSLKCKLIEDNRVVFPLNVKRWLDYLGGLRLSIGARIHGNVAACLAGVPAYVICTDSRTLELCEYFEIPHSKEKNFNFQQSIGSLFEKTDWDLPYKNHHIRYDRFVKFLYKNGLQPKQKPFDEFEKREIEIQYLPVVKPISHISGIEMSERLNSVYDDYERRLEAKTDTIKKLKYRLESS